MKALTKKRLVKEKKNLSPKPGFLFEYKRDKKHIYGFVEGPEDICFYQNFIKNHLTGTDCKTHFFPCGNRKKVLDTYTRIDWGQYSVKRVLFFVDRDLSDFFMEDKVRRKENIYVTDGYSIENSIVTDELLIRHLQESGAIPVLDEKAERFLRKRFSALKKEFCIGLFDVMIWFIFLKLNKQQPIINNLHAKQIITIENMNLVVCSKHKKVEIFEKYTNIKPKINRKINRKIRNKFLSNKDVTKYVRGKFLIDFFSMFTNDLFKNYKTIPELINCEVRKHGVTTNIENFAHRCKCPTSLINFFKKTIDKR